MCAVPSIHMVPDGLFSGDEKVGLVTLLFWIVPTWSPVPGVCWFELAIHAKARSITAKQEKTILYQGPSLGTFFIYQCQFYSLVVFTVIINPSSGNPYINWIWNWSSQLWQYPNTQCCQTTRMFSFVSFSCFQWLTTFFGCDQL